MDLKCNRCSKSCEWLETNKDQFECSHIDCMARRQTMALEDLVAYSCNDINTTIVGYKRTPPELDE